MSASGLEILDTSVQKMNIWLKDLMERLETADRHQAYIAQGAPTCPARSAQHRGGCPTRRAAAYDRAGSVL